MEESRFIDFSKELMEFIDESPSAFHVTANFAEMLKKNGYSQLNEQDKWNLLPGEKYYVTRNGSSIIAFCIPKNNKISNFQIAAAHSDSPTFKIKENPEW